MAHLYSDSVISENRDPDSGRLKVSIPELFASHRVFLVEGVRIWRRKNPEEWQEYLAQSRKDLERMGFSTGEEIARMIEIKNQSHAAYDNTGVYMISHPPASGFKSQSSSLKQAMWDESLNLLAEITAPARRIDCFRLQDRSGRYDDFLHQKIRFAKAERRLLYDGTMHDALIGFAQAGYAFNLWDKVWCVGDLKDGNKTDALDGIVPAERASLDDILKLGMKDSTIHVENR
ncbi:MAG TPA: hypothetical protein VJB08_01205 [Candidatus Nanoarchaeia archaeon]|nr:hypothetical protein [Candidatus Nanoarchaeia archaeon]